MRSPSSRRSQRGAVIALLSCLCALAFSGSARTGVVVLSEYTVQDTGMRLPLDPDPPELFPAINERGQVAAGHAFGPLSDQRFRAARTNGTLTSLLEIGTFGGNYSNAFGINVNVDTQEAQVSGEATDDSELLHAFRYTDSGFPPLQDLGTFGGPFASALRINNRGYVVGEFGSGGGTQAFLFTNTIQPLGFLFGGSNSSATSLNESSWVVGHSDTVTGAGLQTHAFLKRPGGSMVDLGTLENGEYSNAWDINNANPVQIVGESTRDGGTVPHAFRHTPTPFPSKIDLGTLPGHDSSIAFAVNDLGTVVGTSYADDGSTRPRAFIWQDSNDNGVSDVGEMRDLNDLLPSGSGWELLRATDINNAGQIVGVGLYDDVTAVFRLSPPDGEPPSFNFCSVFPTELSANGGDVTICAEVTDGVNVDRVEAFVTRPDSGIDSVLLSRISGTDLYCGLYTVPENFSGSDEVYDIELEAEDTLQNVSFETCESVTVLPNAPPEILSCSVQPLVRTHPGGAFTITAEVTDDTGLYSVDAVVTLPDMMTDVPVELTRQGSTDTFVGVYNAPANTTAANQVYLTKIVAYDNFDEDTRADCDSFTVLANAPPVISSCEVDPTSLLATGGSVQISATATDDVAVASVIARIALPAGGTQDVALPRVGMTNNFAGSYNAPSNTTSADQSYGVTIIATDGPGASDSEPCEPFVVRKNAPPVITNCEVIPGARNANGGDFQICADVTDDISVDTVEAEIATPEGGTVNVTLTRQGVTDTFCGVYTAPPNTTNEDVQYGVQIIATDSFDATTTEECEPFTVLENAPPLVLSCSVTPFLLGPGGGVATVNAHILDETGVEEVTVQVGRPGFSQSFSLSLASGTDHDGNWSGTFNIPANNTASILHYQFDLTATDDRGASTTGSCGSVAVECTVVDNEAPKITACSATPRFLPSDGGNVTVTATVTDNIGLTSVQARLSGPFPQLVDMSPIGKDQYQAVLSIPGLPTSQQYAVYIEARDGADHLTSVLCENIRIAAEGEGIPGRVTVTPRALNYGQVKLGQAKTLVVTVKHVGGSPGSLLVFQVGGLHSPFTFVDGVGSFGTPSPQYLTLAPGQSRNIRIRFRPTALGTYIQNLLVLTNDPEQPVISVRCVGKGCRAR